MNLATERISLRTTPDAKNVIEQAASLTGLTVNSFMVQLAYEKAKDLIEANNSIKANNANRDMILDLLANPPQPTQALKDIMDLIK